MEVEPFCNGEKYIPTAMGPLDLICDHLVISGADAAHFSSLYRNPLACPDELVIFRLEYNGKDDV